MQQDLTFGEDIRGDYALFIENKHFKSEWEIDSKVKSFLKNNSDVIFFRVINDGEEKGSHGYIENGEIIQWG